MDRLPRSDEVTPWPSPDTYAMAYVCRVCGARRGEPCDIAGHPRALQGNGYTHTRRTDHGNARRMRDEGNAPWPEERIPGKRYDSLPAEAEHWASKLIPERTPEDD